ncbi:hypothetical protein BEWA_012620 [Theileria equi strain WA]|uniref:Uncharacterized protein n=1 Tax=Theileria equi strain WA TaxID=1537102 RepID=L1LC01_THEEQ|nr:hypothetical protein BEWA_012620 [Theileria equi strain WA]EKX72703.1 hypothetical protein BEWA_012620 [Theileria equi strain WA]|eukprot:XP_004832155.1 hypothetical protein BEWA_012620 [Theileria equi strain WA]
MATKEPVGDSSKFLSLKKSLCDQKHIHLAASDDFVSEIEQECKIEFMDPRFLSVIALDSDHAALDCSFYSPFYLKHRDRALNEHIRAGQVVDRYPSFIKSAFSSYQVGLIFQVTYNNLEDLDTLAAQYPPESPARAQFYNTAGIFHVTLFSRDLGHNGVQSTPVKGNTNGGGQGAGSITYYGGSPNQVKLTKIEDPPGSGFWKFTHGPPSEDSFTVAQVVFGSNTVSDIGANTGENIQHLAVWYWKGAGNMNQPLLTEVKKSGQYIYKSAKPGGGNLSWRPHPGKQELQTTPLTDKELEQKLDGINCSLNDAVTINLTFQNSSSLSDKHKKSRDDNTYCCSTHCPQGTSGRVYVEKVKVSCKQNHRSGDCYKHEFTPSNGLRVAAIKYDPTGGSTRRRITPSGLGFPVSDITAVYAFYSGNNPKLIYVEGNGQKRWFKSPTGSDKDELWTEVTVNINNVEPENITECTHWTQVKGALKEAKCGSYPQCPQQQPPPPPPPLPGGAGPPEPKGPDGNKGAQEDTANGKGDSGDGGKVEGAKGTEDSYSSDSKAGDDGYDGVGSTVTSQHTFSPDLATNTQVEGSEAASNSSGGAPDTTPPEPPPTTQAHAAQKASGSTAGNSGPGPSHGGPFWDSPERSIPTVLTGVGAVSGSITGFGSIFMCPPFGLLVRNKLHQSMRDFEQFYDRLNDITSWSITNGYMWNPKPRMVNREIENICKRYGFKEAEESGFLKDGNMNIFHIKPQDPTAARIVLDEIKNQSSKMIL